jgi:hypothetical protein
VAVFGFGLTDRREAVVHTTVIPRRASWTRRSEVFAMVKQRGEVEDRRRDLPRDAERFALGLETDRYLFRAKLMAGAVSEVLLVGMLVTSLFRAPSLEWTVLLAVVTAGLGIAMSAEVSRHRTARRRRSDL